MVQVKIKRLINHHSSELSFPCTPLENESHFFQIFVLLHFCFGSLQEGAALPHPLRSVLAAE